MRSPVNLHSLRYRYACLALQLSTDDAASHRASHPELRTQVALRPMRERSSTPSPALLTLALLAALTNPSRAQQDFNATTPALQAPTGAVSSIRVKTAGDSALDASTADAFFDDARNGFDRLGTFATPPPQLCVASEAAAGGDGAIRQVSARAHRTERSDRSRAPYHGGWGQQQQQHGHHHHHHHRRRCPAIVPPSTSPPLLRLAC